MLIPPNVKSLIRLSLEEDLGRGDLTALAVPASTEASAQIVAREGIVLAGSWLLTEIAEEAGAALEIEWQAREGDRLVPGQNLVQIRGNARDLLGLERTWLNFLQRTCGVATQAARYHDALGPMASRVRVTDTRKTIPGWRYLDKYSVKTGGLHNHRFGLDGGILVKENHIRAAGGIAKAIATLKMEVPHGLKIQVEVTNRAEAMEALNSGAEALLLDNFNATALANLIPELRKTDVKVLLEASGGVTLENIRAFADTGVDLISVGALTHSAPAANLSLLFKVL